MSSNRKRRHKLFLQDPHCHWCGCEVVESQSRQKNQQDNSATLDHLRTKFDPQRGEPSDKEQTVLSCYKCNNERGMADELIHFKQSPEIKHRVLMKVRYLEELLEKDPHCHFCGCQVFRIKISPKKHRPKNAACLGHLRTICGAKYDIVDLHKKVVLSCLGCNTERWKKAIIDKKE